MCARDSFWSKIRWTRAVVAHRRNRLIRAARIDSAHKLGIGLQADVSAMHRQKAATRAALAHLAHLVGVIFSD